MRCDEGAVARRMPVLRQHDMVETLTEAIDDRHHGVAISNRQRTVGAEIILHIDDQQHIVIADLHIGTCARIDLSKL